MNSKLSVNTMIDRFLPLVGLTLLVIVITVMNQQFLSPDNLLNLLRQVSINGLIAFGMTFVILTGGIDLSVGSILAFSSAMTALIITSGVDPMFAMLLGCLVGLLAGAVNGLLVTAGGMAPFIATLATMTIYRGATLVVTDGNPITGLGDSLMFQLFGKGYFFGIPVPAVTMAVTFVILYIILNKTVFGRRHTQSAATKPLQHCRA